MDEEIRELLAYPDEIGRRVGFKDLTKMHREWIHAYIDQGIPPPNAPITLEGGWMRKPVSGKPTYIKGKSGTTPLVETGQLYNDFDYEITKR